MKVELYNEIKSVLLDIPKIKRVWLWANGILEKEDILGQYPLAFIEFKPLTYGSMLRNQQEVNHCEFVLHLVWDVMVSDDSEMFEVSQEVFVKFQRMMYDRNSEHIMPEAGTLVDWQITFETPRFTDDDAMIQLPKATPEPVVEVVIEQSI